MTDQPHGQHGHINIYCRDQDSVITNFGKHDRVVAFMPDSQGLYLRVDHRWGLGHPSPRQMLDVARKDQGIRGRWTLDREDRWDDGSATDVYFVRTKETH